MKVVVMERHEGKKLKLIKITNIEKSVLILIRSVDSKPEIQAEKLYYNGVEYNRWREHGSFLSLVNRCIGSNFEEKRGNRKIFLESLYCERFEVVIQMSL